MNELLTAADVERTRRNAILSQNNPKVAAWVFTRFADGRLADLRLRVSAETANSKYLGYAGLTQRGVVQALYRLRDGVRVLHELRAAW